MSIVDHAECVKQIYSEYIIRIGSGQLCAGGMIGKDSCGGDSGGPLTIDMGFGRKALLGIVSFGDDECGAVSVPSVYTNVYYYLKWVLDQFD